MEYNNKPAYKSRGEREIADCLNQYGIPFVYEKPTAIIDSGKFKVYYPDFSLDYGLIIEYFGVNKNPEYAERTRHKIRVYKENRLDVISLYPQDICNTLQTTLLNKIDSALEKRLIDFRLNRVGIDYTGRLPHVKNTPVSAGPNKFS